jgi:hypothetical protein
MKTSTISSKKGKYKKLNLKSPRRNTFDKSKINGVVGNFILDTGASNSLKGCLISTSSFQTKSA